MGLLDSSIVMVYNGSIMTSSLEFIEFVCEQLRDFAVVRYRKMFGDYMVYINEKPIVLVCDDTVYIKKIPELEEVMADAPTAVPYEGAKERYVLDIEDRELAVQAIGILEQATPRPTEDEEIENFSSFV